MAKAIAQNECGAGERDEPTLRVLIVRVVAQLGSAVDASELLLRLRDRDAWPQAGEDGEVPVGVGSLSDLLESAAARL